MPVKGLPSWEYRASLLYTRARSGILFTVDHLCFGFRAIELRPLFFAVFHRQLLLIRGLRRASPSPTIPPRYLAASPFFLLAFFCGLVLLFPSLFVVPSSRLRRPLLLSPRLSRSASGDRD